MLAESLEIALRLAREAGQEVMRVYGADFEVHDKDDGSPVTEADLAANRVILKGLRRYFPDDTVLSEESPFDTAAPRGRRVWMVDPLDGTADFAGRTDDFAVMIGLCIAGRPALGVVHAPALGLTWAGASGVPAFQVTPEGRKPLKTHDPADGEPLRILVSRKHRPPAVQHLAEAFGAGELIPRGSVGIKVCLVAGGEADVYLHPSAGTHLWDCCAPEAILRAAGGVLTDAAGRLLSYDLAETANRRGVLAAGPGLHARVAQAVRPHLPAELR
jgi:3'(2'), 5'-bisphosphate nucleotidase